MVYGESGTGSKALQRRVKEAARNATVVRLDEAGWTEVRASPAPVQREAYINERE